MASQGVTRERGTLQKTLPKSPHVILFLYTVLSGLIAAYIFEYSLRDESDKQFTMSFLQGLIGASSSIVGIVYTDPYNVGLSFSISVSRHVRILLFAALTFVCLTRYMLFVFHIM